MKRTRHFFFLHGLLLFLCMTISISVSAQEKTDLTTIPEYSGQAYVELNDNVPSFTEKMIRDAQGKTYESYQALDDKMRCGTCVASINQTLMPTEERDDIGQVKPSGWQLKKYNQQINGNYLYNRCHLIGYQLTGENANKKNLITGTRYLNVDGMLPYENLVADYLKEDAHHKVLYRVTPLYDGNNLVCSGVQMEALSLDDNGKSIQFNVYCYNVQPGIVIDYATGNSSLSPTWEQDVKKVIGAASVKGASPASKTQTAPTLPNAQPQVAPAPPEPQPQVAPAPPTTNAQVWLSATGEKYHSINNCGRMNPSKATQVTEQEALNKGKGKCSKCW